MKAKKFSCDCHVIHAGAVASVKKAMPKEAEVKKLSGFFKTLGDKTRINIMFALEKGEMCVCDLAVVLKMTKSAVSHQLKFLRQADLVRFRREGKMVFYMLADSHVKAVFDMGREHINEKQK